MSRVKPVPHSRSRVMIDSVIEVLNHGDAPLEAVDSNLYLQRRLTLLILAKLQAVPFKLSGWPTWCRC